MGIVHKISVDVVRGFEQKDPRWAAWSEEYSQSQDLFAFWDTTTMTPPSKNDLRAISRQNTLGKTSGQRPGGAASQEIAPFTAEDPEQPVYPIMDPDRVAVLKVVRRVKKTTTKTVTGLKVIGDRREKKDLATEALDSILSTDGVEVLFETDSFMLQSGQETFQEKFEIKETFGDPVLFTFGERQKIFQYGGVLIDTESWQWKEKFLYNYNRWLRGSAAIKNDAVVLLITNSAIIRGYLLSCSVLQNDQTHGYVGFSFSMFAQDRIPLNEIEPSPQDRQQADQDESVPTIFYTITDKVSKPGEPVKTLERTAGSIELPSGFQLDNFNQAIVGPATHFKAGGLTSSDGTVNGQVAAPLRLTFSTPGQASYTPPDIEFNDPMPAAYKNEVILGTLGTLSSARRSDLEAPASSIDPENPGSIFSMALLESIFSTSIQSGQILFYMGGVSGVSKYTRAQATLMAELAKAGNLSVKIMIRGQAASAPGVPTRKVKAVRLSGGTDTLRSGPSDVPVAFLDRSNMFELELEKAIPYSPDVVHPTNPQQYWIEIFEDNKFVVSHVSSDLRRLFHWISAQKMRSVGSETGGPRAVDSTQKHVLTDAAATFVDDLQANLDAGDTAYVTLPYAVVDEDNKENLIPTAKVKVYKVLSQTTLQLGLLRKLPANKTDVERQRLGKVELTAYKVIVERGTSLKLVDSKIKTRVKDPDKGAFSNTDLKVAELIQPQGAFKMEEGVHYTT